MQSMTTCRATGCSAVQREACQAFRAQGWRRRMRWWWLARRHAGAQVRAFCPVEVERAFCERLEPLFGGVL